MSWIRRNWPDLLIVLFILEHSLERGGDPLKSSFPGSPCSGNRTRSTGYRTPYSRTFPHPRAGLERGHFNDPCSRNRRDHKWDNGWVRQAKLF